MPSFLACFRCGHLPVELNAGSRSESSRRETLTAVDKVFSLKKQDADSFCGTAAASLGRSVSVASCGYSDEYTDCEASGQEEGCGHTRSHLSCSSTTDHASRTTRGSQPGGSGAAAVQAPAGAPQHAGIRSHLPSTRSHGRGRRVRNSRMGSARTSSHTHRHSSTPPTAAAAAAPVDGGVALPLTPEQMAVALVASARPAAQAAAACGSTSPVPELHASTLCVQDVGAGHRESEGGCGSGGSRASTGRGGGSSCGSEVPTDFPTTGSVEERSSGGSSAPAATSLPQADAGEAGEEGLSEADCDGRRLSGCSPGPLQQAPQLPPSAQQHQQQHQQQLQQQPPVDPLAFRFDPVALATLRRGRSSTDGPMHNTNDHGQQPGHLQHSSSLPYATGPWPSTTPHAVGPHPRSPLGPGFGPSPAPASASPGHTGSPAQRYQPSLRPDVLHPARSLTNQTHVRGSFTGGHASPFMPRLTAAASMGHSHSLTERCGSITTPQRAAAWVTPPASPCHSQPHPHQHHLSPGLPRCGSCSSNTGGAPPLPPSPRNPGTSVLVSKGLVNTAASHVVRQRAAGVAPTGASPGIYRSEDSPASVPILGRPLQRPQLPGRFAAPGGPGSARHRRASLADASEGRYGVPYGHVAGHEDARPEVMLLLEGGCGDGRHGGSVGTAPREDLMYDLYGMRRQEVGKHNQMAQVQRHLQQRNQELREAFGVIRRTGSLTAGRGRPAASGGGGGGAGWGPGPSAQESGWSGGRQGPGSGVGQQLQVPGNRLWRARRASCSSVVDASDRY